MSFSRKAHEVSIDRHPLLILRLVRTAAGVELQHPAQAGAYTWTNAEIHDDSCTYPYTYTLL